MSHAPAHAHSHSVGTNLNVGKNLAALTNDAIGTSKNALINGSNAIFAIWQNTVSRVGDILIKKPTSAVLHLQGWPVAKVIDKTLSGILKVLSFGKIGEVKPLATVLKTTNSAVASIVDSVANVKPQWTDRQWHGTRGYIRHVKSKLSAWKQKNTETRAQKKADRLAKKAAKKEADHNHHADHAHTTMADKVDHHESKKETHPPHTEKHHDNAPKKTEHAHHSSDHAPEHSESTATKEPDHGHADHKEEKHGEKHAETPTPATHAPAHDHADHSADKTNEAPHEDNHPAGH